MATLKIALDSETYTALMQDAARHLRPADWHVKAILRQALGLPFPYPAEPEAPCLPRSEHATR
jgi:plasmid stability protein